MTFRELMDLLGRSLVFVFCCAALIALLDLVAHAAM